MLTNEQIRNAEVIKRIVSAIYSTKWLLENKDNYEHVLSAHILNDLEAALELFRKKALLSICDSGMTVWMHKGGDIFLRYPLQYRIGWYDCENANGWDCQPESFFNQHCIYIGQFSPMRTTK